MKITPPSERGFALVSSLAILSILVILIVAFSMTMRTERSASQNFLERERAQAIGQAVLSRIMADHAAPKVGNSRLKPYAVDPTTKLPTSETDKVYNAIVPDDGIFTIKPMDGLSTANHLVRISRPSGWEEAGGTGAGNSDFGDPAYTPADWAWARQKSSVNGDGQADEKFFQPQSSNGTPIAPQWIDYKEVLPPTDGEDQNENQEPVAVGQVAFCIWDESGKVDINLAGEDPNINGMAPHNLGFEQLVMQDKQQAFLTHLNGEPGNNVTLRDRSNFSLRRISNKPQENNRGNDRWFFSVEEMLARGFFTSENVLNVTHSSRDFDVRPEWDGDRSAANAKKFLRSYINNPKLFELFTHNRAGAHLVMDDMNESKLKQRLAQNGFAATDDWMQVMRLLVALRTSLPPFRANIYKPTADQSLSMTSWSDYDVFGIALNIMQASAPASDQNLFAFDRSKYGVSPFNDPNVRTGIRVSPYITETALRLTRLNNTQVKIEQFYEFWNPYAVPLTKKAANGQSMPIKYYYGNWTGGHWDTSGNRNTGGIWSMTGSPGSTPRWILGSAADPNPGPGEFVVKRLPERVVTWNINQDFEIRTRPYIQNADYWDTLRTGGGAEESHAYAVSIGPFYTVGGSDPKYNLVHYLNRSLVDRRDPNDPTGRKYLPVWHSFQIDDPRMAPFTRYTANYQTQVLNGFKYSWKAYSQKHSLFGIPEDGNTPEVEKFVSPHGDGYNENFGENWLPGMNLSSALATFALPQRPFLNVSELGTIFANRPWRTLSFASTTVPQDTTLIPGNKPQNFPTALLDYLTTVGTTSAATDLNYKQPGAIPPGAFKQATFTARKQDDRWLFESVDSTGAGNGNLRPIRGRINLNSASRETLKLLLSAPYRVVKSNGLPSGAKPVDASNSASDMLVEITPADADMVAAEIVGDPGNKVKSIRPLRSMADLGKLTSIAKLHAKYADPIVDAVVGRLAQFGTVRQQIYTVDVIARALNTEVEKKRRKGANIPRVVTGEIRFMARIYFDTFSRRGFVESIEYR